jgi:hypothetical protein
MELSKLSKSMRVSLVGSLESPRAVGPQSMRAVPTQLRFKFGGPSMKLSHKLCQDLCGFNCRLTVLAPLAQAPVPRRTLPTPGLEPVDLDPSRARDPTPSPVDLRVRDADVSNLGSIAHACGNIWDITMIYSGNMF